MGYKRKTIPRRFLGGSGPQDAWRTLGLTGAGRGAGITHLAVWTANWLASVRQERTAVLEWNGHGDFERMRRQVRAVMQEDGFWSLMDVDYFPAAGSRTLAACMDRGYRRILVDYGELTEQTMQECARCDRKLLLASLSEWKAERFLETIRSGAWQDSRWRCAAAFGSEELRLSIERELKVPVLRIPYAPDAFAVTGADLEFFRTWRI